MRPSNRHRTFPGWLVTTTLVEVEWKVVEGGKDVGGRCEWTTGEM